MSTDEHIARQTNEKTVQTYNRPIDSFRFSNAMSSYVAILKRYVVKMIVFSYISDDQ